MDQSNLTFLIICVVLMPVSFFLSMKASGKKGRRTKSRFN